jgi:hypothetical protein
VPFVSFSKAILTSPEADPPGGAGHPAAPGLMEAAKGLIVGATQRLERGFNWLNQPKIRAR